MSLRIIEHSWYVDGLFPDERVTMTTANMAHSPLPGTFPHNLNRALQYIEDDQSSSFETTLARAELAEVAASLNSHQALVEALEKLVNLYGNGIFVWGNEDEAHVYQAFVEARAALTLARGASV